MKIALGSDEKTYLTERVHAALEKRGHAVELFGPLRAESLNWVQVAQAVAETVTRGDAD